MKVANADAQLVRKLQSANESQQEDAISLDDAYETLEHDKQWKGAILNIVFSLVLLALFLAMLFSHTPASNIMYELGDSVSSTLAGSGADTITPDSTVKFTNIETIGDTFDWLIDSFVPSVFVTEDYNGNALAKDKWGRVAMFNKVLGGVIFEATRAAIHPCQAQQFLVDLYPNCYDPDTTTVENVLIPFDTNATEATDVITKLKTRGDWLDFATQSLAITVVMYNGELQAYAVTELTLEFHQGGSVEPRAKTTATLAEPYKTTTPLVLDVLIKSVPIIEFVIFLIAAFYYFWWILLVSAMNDQTFRDDLARLVVSGKKFDVGSDERKGLLAVVNSLTSISFYATPLRAIAVYEIVLLSFRVLTAFHAHPRLGLLTRTISIALKQFRWVFVVFAVVFVMFATVGTILFGSRVKGFSSLGTSFETCVNILFGSFDYATIQDVNFPAPLFFYWGYMVVVSLVLLNIMLAIVVDAYGEVSAATSETTKNLSMSRVIANVAWDVVGALPRCLKRKGRGNAHARRELHKLFSPRGPRPGQARVLALCNELAHEDVVSRGRINDQLLRKVLRALRVNRSCDASNGKDADASTVMSPETLVVSAASLKNWFARAEISDDIARATMAFLYDGVNSGGESESTGRGSTGLMQRTLDSSVVSSDEHTKEEEIAPGEVTPIGSADVADNATPLSPRTEDDDGSLAQSADSPVRVPELAQGDEGTKSPDMAHLLQQMAAMELKLSQSTMQTRAMEQTVAESLEQTRAMEQKLDRLLRKMASE